MLVVMHSPAHASTEADGPSATLLSFLYVCMVVANPARNPFTGSPKECFAEQAHGHATAEPFAGANGADVVMISSMVLR